MTTTANPILFLAFANDRDDRARYTYLRNLAEEAGFDVRVFPSQRADKYRRHIPAASAAPAAGTGG